MRVYKEVETIEKKQGVPWVGIILIGIFLVCMIGVIYWLIRNNKEESVNQVSYSLINENEDDSLDDDKIEDENTYKDPKPLEFVEVNGVKVQKKFKELYESNSDFVGWIKIKDTNINYPVCQRQGDNEYYLNYNIDNNSSVSGCIFLDANATLDKSDNMILHGHHMRIGTMFQNLLSYEDEEFYQKHKKFRFDTINGNGRYEVVAVFRTKIYENGDENFQYQTFFDAKTENEFDEYIKNIKALSIYDTGVEVEYGEMLLTLSTCAYHEKNGRMVVVAKKIWSN